MKVAIGLLAVSTVAQGFAIDFALPKRAVATTEITVTAELPAYVFLEIQVRDNPSSGTISYLLKSRLT